MTRAKSITILIFFVSAFFLFCAAAYAQDYENSDSDKKKDVHMVNPDNAAELQPGMELMKIGGINMVVPKGTQFYKEGAQVKMEEAGEYSARRFKEMDDRLQKIEAKQRKMETEIEKLRYKKV